MDLKELPGRGFTRHPWEIVRANFFLRLIGQQVKGEALRALDIGSGDGYFARRLVASHRSVTHLTCFDLAYDAEWMRGRAASEPRMSFTAEEPEGRFNLVLMLDVLEHVDDNRATLRHVASKFLNKGGTLLISVPAVEMLFSRHDEILGHKRRYAAARLRALILESGLAIVARGHLFASLLVPRAAAKLGEVVLGKEKSPAGAVSGRIETPLGTWDHGRLASSLVRSVLSLDASCSRFASRLRLPFAGLSTWVLAQSP